MPKDACYRKVKARYRVFPSAYASGAIAKCRKVGAANYGNKTYPNNNMRQRYITYEAGNRVRRTNFAGYVANKFSKEVAIKLAPSIGEDVASMIREKIKNNTKAKVS